MSLFGDSTEARTPLGALRQWLSSRRERRRVRRWRAAGCPAPPPHSIKQEIVLDYARRHGCRVLVETGTFYGDMVHAMRPHFDRVYSIELSGELFARACRRFRGCDDVELIHGDSSQELVKLVPQITERALFWLDGHWSAGETAKGAKETPISEELDLLLPLVDQGHVLLVDDARCFGSDADYPALERVQRRVEAETDDGAFEVEQDIIRIARRTVARLAA